MGGVRFEASLPKPAKGAMHVRFELPGHRACLAGIAGLLLAAPAASAADPVFTEFAGGITPNSLPSSVAPGPDGNLWMGEARAPGRIAKVTPAGGVTEFTGGVTPGLRAGHVLTSVARGPDGNLWFGDFTNDGGVVKITPGGAVTEYPRNVRDGSFTTAITAGPDGNLWFTEQAGPGRITKVTPAGEMTTMASGGTTPGFSANAQPRGITLGPDGNLWFTEFASPGRIGRITPDGVVTEFPIAPPGPFSVDRQPVGITAGPDGNLWFTEASGRIGRITTAGVVTEFAVPGSQPDQITSGPDGALWFTEPVSPGAIGRITTAGVVTRFVAGATPGFTAGRAPAGITTGADGNAWFTEAGNPGAIVRINLGTVAPAPSATATATATVTPGPGPGPGNPPASTLAPRITGLTSNVPMVAGSPALLAAQVLGDAQHLDWDLNGDGKTEVSCPADQPTLRFRPSLRAGAARAAAVGGSVSVKAVGPGGASPVLSQTFEVAPPQPTRSNPIKDAVVKLVAEQPTPYMCGLARDLVPAMVEIREDRKDGKDRPCLGGTLQAGALTLTGCFKAIYSIADIPPAERGIVEGLASTIGHASGVKPDIPNTRLGLGGFDGFVSVGGALTINGAALTPGPKASLVVYTQANKIVSSDAALAVAGIALEKKPGPFTLDTTPDANGRIPVGSFVRASGPDDLGMLPMAGKLQLSLMPGAIGQPAAKISTNIKLPSFFNLGGNAPAYARVTLSVTADGKLALDELHVSLPKVNLGLMEVTKLTLDFTRSNGDSVWNGQASVGLLDAKVDASITIRNGAFGQASADVTLPGDGLPLYPNVNLTRIGAGVSVDPTTFRGSIRVNAYKLYEINGRVALAFPSKAHPFVLSEATFPGLTSDDYKRSFEVFTLAAAGDASLRFEPLNLTVPLGNAYFLYSWPGYVHVGGEVHQDFGPVTLTGRTNGEFNLKNGKFNFGQDMEACFLKWACRTATTRLSSRGVGACFSLEVFGASVTVGGGVLFDPFEVLPSITGCRWSEFADPQVFDGKAAAAQASAAQASGSFAVTIKPGDPSRSIRLDGAAQAPRVRVTAPNGQVLDSPAGPEPALTPALRVLTSDELKSTIVGLFEPKPGTYKIDLLPGSPEITKVTESEDPGPARVTARVSGRGTQRRLTYDVERRPDQKVTFVEVAAAGKRPLGTVTGGKGTLTFSPAPGTDTRRIEAQFELLGIGAETTTVATFRPPSQRLGRPSRVTVHRRSGTLRVAFTPVAEAERYEIVTTLATGGQRTTSTRRTAATITHIARDSGGTVTVRAVAPMRQGAGRITRFRATAPPAKTRFGPLP